MDQDFGNFLKKPNYRVHNGKILKDAKDAITHLIAMNRNVINWYLINSYNYTVHSFQYLNI